MMPLAVPAHFDQHGAMDAEDQAEAGAAAVAAAIGEPARAKMLYCLMDGRARTSTELSVVADVSPSTASAHLNRLKSAKLVDVAAQGKHRYYRLAGGDVAVLLEGLISFAGGGRTAFAPTTPGRLRRVRTCYDHMAGRVGVKLNEQLQVLGWLRATAAGEQSYEVTAEGIAALAGLGIDVETVRKQRRRFACACLDWSERKPHLGGALGAALLRTAFERDWVRRELDDRALEVTPLGQRAFARWFGLQLDEAISGL